MSEAIRCQFLLDGPGMLSCGKVATATMERVTPLRLEIKGANAVYIHPSVDVCEGHIKTSLMAGWFIKEKLS